MSWLYLVAAVVVETIGTACMKLSEGFHKLVPSVLLFIFYALSFGLITLAVKGERIEVSVAYAIWSGAGTALIAVVGILWFQESVTLLKVVSLAMIVLGVVGLNIGGGFH
ncbi:MAG: multidrug efflux SMR transporter [Thermoguttaceae bacterium]